MADQQLPSVDEFADGPAGLRDAYKRARDQVNDRDEMISKLTDQLKGAQIRDAGFEEDSHAYKNLMRYYDGELEPIAIQDYAQREFGYQPQGGRPADPVRAADERAAKLRSDAGTQPLGPGDAVADIDRRIAEAEASNNWVEVVRLQNLRAQVNKKKKE